MAETYVVKPGQRAPTKRAWLWGLLLIAVALAFLAILGVARPWNEMKPDVDAMRDGTWGNNGTEGVFARAAHLGLWAMAYFFPALFVLLGLRLLIFRR
jgi:hypothetical protein